MQRGKILEAYRYFNGAYLIGIAGTGVFHSDSVYCQNGCEKHRRNGKVSFYHQLLAAVIVYPNQNQVIPLAPDTDQLNRMVRPKMTVSSERPKDSSLIYAESIPI